MYIYFKFYLEVFTFLWKIIIFVLVLNNVALLELWLQVKVLVMLILFKIFVNYFLLFYLFILKLQSC